MSDVQIEGIETEAGQLAGPSDFIALLKPRVMSLVVFTALTGLVLAPGGIHPVIAFAAILSIAVGAGASGALNMWYDADIDRVMSRTRNRPIPAGRITRSEALAFGLTLAGLSVLVLTVLVNPVAGALLAFTIFFYVVIYSMWLKRWTPQNIVIGGAAGAFPPIIGWASVTGSVSLESIGALFLIIFMWTPPHFWALALFKSDDYARAGIPMLPVVSAWRGDQRARSCSIRCCSRRSACCRRSSASRRRLMACSRVCSAAFVVLALSASVLRTRTRADTSMKAAKRLFGFSILYLFAAVRHAARRACGPACRADRMKSAGPEEKPVVPPSSEGIAPDASAVRRRRPARSRSDCRSARCRCCSGPITIVRMGGTSQPDALRPMMDAWPARERKSEAAKAAAASPFLRGGRAGACAVFGAAMLGAAYASVPLYACSARSPAINGTTQRAADRAGRADREKTIIVRFDANVANGMRLGVPARAAADQGSARRGRQGQLLRREPDGRRDRAARPASTSSPIQAGRYFHKIACFCFNSSRR